MMSRRALVGLAAGAAVGWSLATQAQARDGIRRMRVGIGSARRARRSLALRGAPAGRRVPRVRQPGNRNGSTFAVTID
jgi:hypothetical protein